MLPYNAKYGKTIATVIKEEFSGDLQKVLVAFVEAFEDYPTFLANRLERSMSLMGVGNYNSKLSSLVVRIKDSGMLERVKAAYFKKYGRTASSTLRLRVGVSVIDFERVMLALIGSN